MTTITVSKRVAEDVLDKHPDFTPYRAERLWRDLDLNTSMLADEALTLLLEQTSALTDTTKEERATSSIVEAVLRTRDGDDKPVASLASLPAILAAWVDANCSRGWLIRKDRTDARRDQAWLVTNATYVDRADGTPSVSVTLIANTPGLAQRERGSKNSGRTSTSIHIDSDDLFTEKNDKGKRQRRSVAALLEDKGFFPPSEADLAEHDSTEQDFERLLATGFASQFRHNGVAIGHDWSVRAYTNVDAKIIHDVAVHEQIAAQPISTVWDSARAGRGEGAEPLVRRVPTMPHLNAFDLAKQVFIVVDARDLTPYEYDKSLRDKLVLPSTHRELLDVLTTDLDDYSDDIVAGKSAGNVILAQGRPGVGKTLTAEVYAEIVERPLYSIHSGSLGTSAESVRKNLEAIFARAARWDAVLLLDEADVFVIARGESVEQNAIVAEFLRTLEYFKGLLFMTTNRSDQIDDAILSRCAAIIKYTTPTPTDAVKVWNVMVANAKAESLVDAAMVETLVETYPDIAPRDVKMVLRLALRIAASRNQKPDLAIFERCMLFRGLTD